MLSVRWIDTVAEKRRSVLSTALPTMLLVSVPFSAINSTDSPST